MKQLRIVTAMCAFNLSIAQVKAEDRFLVDDGTAYAEIIISESPMRLAAAELQTCAAKKLLHALGLMLIDEFPGIQKHPQDVLPGMPFVGTRGDMLRKRFRSCLRRAAG